MTVERGTTRARAPLTQMAKGVRCGIGAIGWTGLALGMVILATGSGVSGCSPQPDESDTLVIVNGKPITQSEFDVRWSELPGSTQERYKKEGGQKKFLDDLISRKLLLQEAQKIGLDQTPAFRERLQRAKDQMLLDALMSDVLKDKVEISDKELQDFYASHVSMLPQAQQIRAAQIVVPTIKQATELKQQLDGGADFADLARRFSMDQATKAKGGDLGQYRKGQTPPQVEAVLLSLKPGTVSQPIETSSGFHLVKVLSRQGEDKDTVVRERLRQELVAEKRRQQFEDYLRNLRTMATIRMKESSKYLTDKADTKAGSPSP